MRVNLHDEQGNFVGWYDNTKGSSLTHEGQRLVRTSNGRWVLERPPAEPTYIATAAAHDWITSRGYSLTDIYPDPTPSNLPPGRPRIGDTRFTMTITANLLDRIDAVRGQQSRADWIREAIHHTLPPLPGK